MSPVYSQSNCRQAPHGGVGASVSATTASIVKSRWPSVSALSKATRSAQTVSPYVAFSTLAPVMTVPSRVSSAAPTLKCEYGATARSRASRAAATRRSESAKDALQQRDERGPHAASRLDDLFLGEQLRQDARGHVRDAGDSQHLQSHVPRDDGFGDGGHADGVSTEGAERADLGGR